LLSNVQLSFEVEMISKNTIITLQNEPLLQEKTERHKLLSAWDMSAKITANEIQTHARTNQRHTLDRGFGNP